jgi:hypothetical protein
LQAHPRGKVVFQAPINFLQSSLNGTIRLIVSPGSPGTQEKAPALPGSGGQMQTLLNVFHPLVVEAVLGAAFLHLRESSP